MMVDDLCLILQSVVGRERSEVEWEQFSVAPEGG